jgi:hypothetical protein
VTLTGVNGNVIMSGCADATLTMRDEKRTEIIERVFRSELTVRSAAVLLGLSERQCYCIKQRVHPRESREWFTAIGAGLVSTFSSGRPRTQFLSRLGSVVKLAIDSFGKQYCSRAISPLRSLLFSIAIHPISSVRYRRLSRLRQV